VTPLVAADVRPPRPKIAKFIYPTCVQRPRWRWPVGISQRCLLLAEIEWLDYHMLKKVWWYVKLFRYSTGCDRRTDEQTDGQNCRITIARQHCCRVARGSKFWDPTRPGKSVTRPDPLSCLPCPRQLNRYSNPTCCQLLMPCHLNLTVSTSQHSMWWHGQCLWCACSPFTTSSSETIAVVKFRRNDVFMRGHVSEKWDTNGWWPSAAATCCKTARQTTILMAPFLQTMQRA